MVDFPGLSWTGFLAFTRKQLQQEDWAGSTCPIDPSGFNPLPMAQEEQIENELQAGEK